MRGQRSQITRNGRRRLSRSRRGVAAILGALFALLIFLVAFGLVLTQALPVWMAQDENAFTQSAEGSLAALQSTIGLQSATGAPQTAFTPISLSSSAVPVLASSTVGSIAFQPPSSASYVNVSWSVAPGGPVTYRNATLGRLVVTLPNRYIASEVLNFQDGAVFSVAGSTPAAMLYGPPFSVIDRPGNLSLALTVTSLSGSASIANGPGVHQIGDTLLGSNSTSTAGPAIRLTLEVASSLACAWGAFYLAALSAADVPTTQYAMTGPTSCYAADAGASTFALTLTGVQWISLDLIDLGVALGSG